MQVVSAMSYGFSGLLATGSSSLQNVSVTVDEVSTLEITGNSSAEHAVLVSRNMLVEKCKTMLAQSLAEHCNASIAREVALQASIVSFSFQVML